LSHPDGAVKFAPTAFSGRFRPTPVAVIAQAVRRVWARVAGIGGGERSMLEDAVRLPGDLDSRVDAPATCHDLRHDAAPHVFKAPGLVYDPPVHGQPLRRPLPAGEAHAGIFAPGRGSRSSDRFNPWAPRQ
jgi:hypothetical protein